MNVIREEIDALNAVLTVKISSVDYQLKVKNALEKYRKNAKIPGFRPGHVPFGLIQKQYGKAVLAEELNKLTNDSLYHFISENQLNILGNPIPKADAEIIGSFDQPGDFEFSFEIGYSPVFELPISAKSSFNYNKVKIDKSLINKQVEDLRRRYGKLVSSELVGEKDMLIGKFEELNSDGNLREGGISHSSTISMEFLDNKKTAKHFLGKIVGDQINIDPKLVSKGEKDLASMLGIGEEQTSGISKFFRFTIQEIKRMEMADLNEELYNKLFIPGEVNSEEALRNRISIDLEKMFTGDSDRLLTREVYNYLLEKTKIQFPEAFLKKWIKLSNEKALTEDEIERDFSNYLQSLKWQLIQTKIFKDNNIQLSKEEVIAYTKELLVGNYAQYGIPAPEDAELNETALRLLKNKEQSNSIYDKLAEQKLTQYFKSTVSLKSKELSYEDFLELAKG
ncbi:MAG: trigger factor [Bacteroidetes bacterium]|nr:trigger factor [Bacteroidota bacterium]